MAKSAGAKVAIITGGASGMGYETALAISQRETWHLHLFDIDEEAGISAAKSIPYASFHKVDISSYASLASAFHKVYTASKRLDFVYANAGIFEKPGFYDEVDDDEGPPPEPMWPGFDINLKGTVNTCYLARHYFRLTGQKNGSLVITASCTGLYPSESSPRYCASKAGILMFMRAVAPAFFAKDSIRLSAVLPGAVKTNFLKGGEWPPYPDHYFTPTSKIAKTVEQLVYGELLEDSRGRRVSKGSSDFGLAVEVNVDKVYFREQPEYCDEVMATIMGVVSVESAEKIAKEKLEAERK